MLSTQEWQLIGIIVLTLIAIMSGRLRPDLVAILLLVGLPVIGLVSFEEAVSGFSRSVVITIIGLFMISQALEDTGVVRWVADRLRRVGGGSETRLLLLFMSTGALLSLVMNNIAAGAVLLPAAVQVARQSKVSPSKILIPLSFGTLVGGMATYFTTANIILSSILTEQGQRRLTIIDFMPTGGLIVVATILYMAFIGRRLLPDRQSVGQTMNPMAPQDLYEAYQLGERLWEVDIMPESLLANKSLQDSGIGHDLGLSVLNIYHGRHEHINPEAGEVLHVRDKLLVLGREERILQMCEWGCEVRKVNGHDPDFDLTEVIIPPRSGAKGKSLADLQFRSKYHLTAVALWREGRSYRTDVGIMPLEVGDALLMIGTPERVSALAKERDYLMLHHPEAQIPLAPRKGLIAVAITILVLLLSIFEIVPAAQAMLIGAAGLALTGCINLDDAYRGIEWRVIFLIAGMLPLSIAMVHTGLAERLGSALVDTAAPFGPMVLVGALFLLTMLVTQIIGGQVASLLIGPIAISSALEVGVNPQAVAVAVAIACSTAFLTPIAHPVNVLMMGPGGYAPRDFFKVGAGMTLVTLITLLVGMVVFWDV